MTISSSLAKETWLGNNHSTEFPYTMKIITKSDVSLYQFIPFNGVTFLVSPDDYEITGVGVKGPGGGTIIYSPGGFPLASPRQLILVRWVPYTQTVAIANQGGFFPDVVEGGLDRLEMQIQQEQEQLDRAMLQIYTGGPFEGKGKRIIHLADGIDDSDAATVHNVKIIPKGDKGDRGTSGNIFPISIVADYAASTNVKLVPGPNLSVIGNHFVIDGNIVVTGDTVFLSNQTNGIENGVYRYDLDLNTLTRVPAMAVGVLVEQPYFVEIEIGDTFGGSTFQLASPSAALIGTDATVWSDAETGAGLQPANSVVAGPYLPYYGNRPASVRQFSPADISKYDASSGLTSFSQSIYRNLNNFGFVSRYWQQSVPLSNRAAIHQAINEFNTVIFDMPVYLEAQITASLSNKRLVFGGAANLVLMRENVSFCDLSDEKNVRFEGQLIARYRTRAAVNAKFIKGTNTTNFKADEIFTQGIDYAVNVAGTLAGFSIDKVGVFDPALDIPLLIASASASYLTKVKEITGMKAAKSGLIDAAFTYIAHAMGPTINWSPVVILTGAQTANRIGTLSLQNYSEGFRALFVHQATGGFNYDIGGLKTIVNGQTAEVMMSNGAWVLLR